MHEDDFHKRLLDQLFDGVYFLDRERRITYWNRGAERITGFGAEEVLRRFCADDVLVHTDAAGHPLCNGAACPAVRAMETGQPVEELLTLRHKAGHRVSVITRVSPIRDANGRVVGAAEVFTDSGAQLASAERLRQLEQLALTDALTGLGNRRLAEQSITGQLEALQRYGWPFGLLFMDVDRFKTINDGSGHDVGDRVLAVMGKTLAGNLRGHDLACRWGGDEFVVLVLNADQGALLEVADKLRALVGRSSYTSPTGLRELSTSIGATQARLSDTLDSLVRRADELMYRSKRAGGNRVSTDPQP